MSVIVRLRGACNKDDDDDYDTDWRAFQIIQSLGYAA